MRFFICDALILAGLLLAPLPAGSAPSPAAPQPESLRDYVQRVQYRQACGVYLDGHKVGWALNEFKLGRHKGREVAVNSSEVHLQMQMGGDETTTDSAETASYSLEGDGGLIQARERVVENKTETLRVIERKGNHIVMTTRMAGIKSVRRASVPKETLALSQALERWLRRPPPPGDRFESWSTEWAEDTMDRREIYTYKGRRPLGLNGADVDACVVSVNQDGMELECLMLPNGQLLQGRMGGLFELRAEPEAAAKSTNRLALVDYMKLLSIQVDRDLGLAARVNKLTLEISGLGGLKMPSSHRQVVNQESSDRARVELRRDFRVPRPDPLAEPDRRRFLAATVSVTSADKAIVALARRLADGEKDPVKTAEKFVAWIQRNLRQVHNANASTALEVMQNKKGDCTEHSLLFVALARARGIPARLAGGVAFVREDQPRFYWHEWAEIHDGHQWITMDPTWNQTYVDATHIKFTEEVEDWSWVNLLGRLKFKVIEVEKR